MNKGDIIQIKVDRYAFEGKGIGKIEIDNQSGNHEPESFIVFVNGAYPGDTVAAKIKKLKNLTQRQLLKK
ncbi:MAG: TRAM domain-containing protein [Ignavibacteriaceae bacterium]|nr:TRAM domain-containing protein [Ignavibacteriaceae bacterium]